MASPLAPSLQDLLDWCAAPLPGAADQVHCVQFFLLSGEHPAVYQGLLFHHPAPPPTSPSRPPSLRGGGFLQANIEACRLVVAKWQSPTPQSTVVPAPLVRVNLPLGRAPSGSPFAAGLTFLDSDTDNTVLEDVEVDVTASAFGGQTLILGEWEMNYIKTTAGGGT